MSEKTENHKSMNFKVADDTFVFPNYEIRKAAGNK